jgi:CRISPR/Cas system CSM-associated protein Csm3 (group 7 of RAMP superfamily)
MARLIHTTLELSGELLALSPIHVGGAAAGPVVDMPMAVDGKGRYYIPGTSLAGALRHWVERHLDGPDWGIFWGSHEKEGSASLIVINDAPATESGHSAPPELWHSVSIDRQTGTAADKLKFDREVLPRGSRFVFRMQVEARDQAELDTARAFLGRLQEALQNGRISFGAAATRGLGRMQLANAKGRETSWATKKGVLDFLRGAHDDTLAAWQQARHELAVANRGQIDITLHWHPGGPLMSKAATDGLAVDGMPFVSAVADGKQALTLPGSGIKGALRSHAERILRTIFQHDVAQDSGNHTHRDQLDLPLISAVFGSAGNAASKGNTGNRGALSVATCYATDQHFDAKHWNDLALNDGAWPKSGLSLQRAYHVAVDRWTGGAADGFLYSAVEPMKVAWEPLRISLQLGEKNVDCLLRFAIVWLLLRELAAGRITLGFGANRGYGEVVVDKIVLDGVPLASHVGHVELDARLATGDQAFGEWLSDCNTAWKSWVGNIEQQLNCEETQNEQ